VTAALSCRPISSDISPAIWVGDQLDRGDFPFHMNGNEPHPLFYLRPPEFFLFHLYELRMKRVVDHNDVTRQQTPRICRNQAEVLF